MKEEIKALIKELEYNQEINIKNNSENTVGITYMIMRLSDILKEV